MVTQKLNTGLSNDPWTKKQKTLFEHTVLHLNKEVLTSWGSKPFEEDAIRARGEALAARALKIWPSAKSV